MTHAAPSQRWRWPASVILLPLLAWGLTAGRATAGTIRGDAACDPRCAEFVVYLEGAAGSYSGAGEVVEFDQENKVFIPHVLPLLKGSTVRIGNSDPFMHNVHARKGGKTVFNVNLLFQYQTLDQVMAEPGVYTITCQPHPEMLAYWVVLDHPFFASPDPTGRFAIPEVPAGSYTLVRYDLGRDRQRKLRVSVGDGETTVDF